MQGNAPQCKGIGSIQGVDCLVCQGTGKATIQDYFDRIKEWNKFQDKLKWK